MDSLARVLKARPVQGLLLKSVVELRIDDATLGAYFTTSTTNAGVRGDDLARSLQRVSG